MLDQQLCHKTEKITILNGHKLKAEIVLKHN